MKKLLPYALVALIVIVTVALVSRLSSKQDNYRAKYEGTDLSADVGNVSREHTYSRYLEAHAADEIAEANLSDVAIDVSAYDRAASSLVRMVSDYQGAASALWAEDGSSVTWNVDVPRAGQYEVWLDYIAAPSRGVDMERCLLINGEMPFTGADSLVFTRVWSDAGAVRTDNRGNAIRPQQREIFAWQTAACKDPLGYENTPYRFFFKQGKNTITLKAVNEPMVLRGLRLSAPTKIAAYEQYSAALAASGAAATSGDAGQAPQKVEIKAQGESAVARSGPSLFARYDRASASTEPYSVTRTVLNYIGGDAWKSPGQWIEWEIDVPSDGQYAISVKARQNYQRGTVACRSLFIDGKVPFAEVEAIGFAYSSDWRQVTLSDASGKPYSFYLTKGKHRVRLEATLGKMGSLMNELQDSIFRLNKVYRTILVLTGSNPDQFRDYYVDKVYPSEVAAMGLESKRLYSLVDRIIEYTGSVSDKTAAAQTLAIQLERFYDRPDKITKTFVNFKDNITSLGGSLLSLSESKLDIDYLVVSSLDVKPHARSTGFFAGLRHQTLSFLASFFVNYDSLGDVYKKDESVITVWLLSGRDQSNVMKGMIDDTFTPATGVKVNVKLVDGSALLNAVVAGKGPDVVLPGGTALPVDYAMRGAVEDLRQFPDFDKVIKPFRESAYASFEYNGGVYGLPETESFNVLFYRKDILEQLGLAVPQTWEELIAMLSTLQGNNLSVGIPYPSTQLPNASVFYSMVYQNGGSLYDAAGTKTVLDGEAGIRAFKTYTSLYNSYGLPVIFDFVNRFRSGEMPIGISDYTTYNTLVVSAPEIKGLWGFAVMPGVAKVGSDGVSYIDRSAIASGSCSMMLKAKNEVTKRNSWEFMRWWASAETQLRFGREIESLLGSSARYATANCDALRQLSWSSAQLSVLESALDQTVGFREVPGGYYTSRHVTNAVNKIINEKEDPRETLIDYARTINEELTKKRQEFGLATE